MIGEIEQPNGANMADVDEVDFLNDDALLDRMQQAASKFNHTISTPSRFHSIARR